MPRFPFQSKPPERTHSGYGITERQPTALGLCGADDEKKKASQEREKDLAGLVEKIESLLGEKVKSVRVSHRLTDSPACLVADEHDLGGNLERILQSMGQEAPEAKPIMEINPDHPLIRQLTPEHDKLEDWSMVLFDQAALSEGAKLSQPAAYVQRVNDLLTRASLLAG